MPWLNDRSLGCSAVFPAAGYLSVAIEALRQAQEEAGQPALGVRLHDIAIDEALILPEGEEGVEIMITLTKTDTRWFSFSVETMIDGHWIVHCNGKMTGTGDFSTTRDHAVDETLLNQGSTGKLVLGVPQSGI